jgi:uncharacterized protein YodC (DUF2158 family)
MSDEFKPGDSVVLKSGMSPVMSTEEFDTEDGSWICVWFEGKKQKRGKFAPAVLKHWEKPRGTGA